MAIMDDDGIVKDLKNIKIGRVSVNGEVFNTGGKKVGSFRENGYIYDEDGKHIGTVRNDGGVYDYEVQRVGKVIGGNIKQGGAALLLLVR